MTLLQVGLLPPKRPTMARPSRQRTAPR
jgi:hypothetical protein